VRQPISSILRPKRVFGSSGLDFNKGIIAVRVGNLGLDPRRFPLTDVLGNIPVKVTLLNVKVLLIADHERSEKHERRQRKSPTSSQPTAGYWFRGLLINAGSNHVPGLGRWFQNAIVSFDEIADILQASHVFEAGDTGFKMGFDAIRIGRVQLSVQICRQLIGALFAIHGLYLQIFFNTIPDFQSSPMNVRLDTGKASANHLGDLLIAEVLKGREYKYFPVFFR
jgi:hypothetical protein